MDEALKSIQRLAAAKARKDAGDAFMHPVLPSLNPVPDNISYWGDWSGYRGIGNGKPKAHLAAFKYHRDTTPEGRVLRYVTPNDVRR